MLTLPLCRAWPCLGRNQIRAKNISFREFAKAQRIKPWEKIADKFFLNNIVIKYDVYVLEHMFLHGAENNLLDHH